LYLVDKSSFSLSLESSGKFTSSYCRMLNTCVQVLTVFILLGEVSEKTSELWPELSPVSLDTFHGGMVAALKYLLFVTKMHRTRYLAKQVLPKRECKNEKIYFVLNA
jgi:hypothetical protein